MSRSEFIQLLARAVRDKSITEAKAARLLHSFDAGELDLREDSLPSDDAVKPANEADIKRAIAALLAIGSLKLLHRKVRQVRETLQDAFQIRGATLAKRYAESQNVRRWQTEFRGSVVENIIQQYAVGAGRVPTVIQVSKSTLEQSAFISRWAEEIALKNLLNEPVGYFQMAARAALYAGAGRAEGYRAEAEIYPEGGAVTYTATDDSGTCQSCLDAEGTYDLRDVFPVPPEVCEGLSNCRCTLTFSAVEA